MAEQSLAELRAELHKKWTTYDDVMATRRATPKYAMKTRLEAKDEKDTDDVKKLEQWKRDVRLRDKGRCRVCGIKTVKTLELDPKRGEAHHITSRKEKAVRHDVRNGLHTCLACHQKFTAGKLFILQAAKHAFTVGVTTYINASKKVTFSAKAAA